MRILLILAGLTLSLAAASQEIWRWVDKNGIVHYSDQPDSPNAELISVIESNTYEGAEATPESSASGGLVRPGFGLGRREFRPTTRSRSSSRRRTRSSSARMRW